MAVVRVVRIANPCDREYRRSCVRHENRHTLMNSFRGDDVADVEAVRWPLANPWNPTERFPLLFLCRTTHVKNVLALRKFLEADRSEHPAFPLCVLALKPSVQRDQSRRKKRHSARKPTGQGLYGVTLSKYRHANNLRLRCDSSLSRQGLPIIAHRFIGGSTSHSRPAAPAGATETRAVTPLACPRYTGFRRLLPSLTGLDREPWKLSHR